MQIERTSSITGIKHFRDIPDVTPALIKLWESSEKHIQDFFPTLSDADREFILSGITPEEWEAIFGEDEDEFDLPTNFDELLRQAEENGQSVEIRLEKE